MKRVIISEKPAPELLSPGVSLERIQPGGRFGPAGEVLELFPGGRTWNDGFLIGSMDQPFQMLVPDLRMPANQLWPLHWHDCWIAVIILDGSCIIGDWWMKKGDVLITAAGVEYGPLLNGPEGCQLFEVFARLHEQAGGYGPEYRDHPTLQGTAAVFRERTGVNRRNEGHQLLAMDGVDGITKGHLTPGSQWNLGDANDPERGVLRVVGLAPGERLPAHRHGDWHAAFVIEGAMSIGDRELSASDVLICQPDAAVAEIVAGPDGALLFEAARTAGGIDRLPLG